MSIELDAPAIGHNSPPSDADVLRERLEAENADLIARLEVLLQSFKMAPEQIPDDDTAGRVADLCKMFSALEKAASERQATERKPHADMLKAINRIYDTTLLVASHTAGQALRARLVNRLAIKTPDKDGVARVRGDNGSVVTLTRPIFVRIEDRAMLDLDALRPHLDEEALLKALRAYVKAGGNEVAGALIERGFSVTIS